MVLAQDTGCAQLAGIIAEWEVSAEGSIFVYQILLDVCHTEGIVLSTMGDKALPSRPPKAAKGESARIRTTRTTGPTQGGTTSFLTNSPLPFSSLSYSSKTPSTLPHPRVFKLAVPSPRNTLPQISAGLAPTSLMSAYCHDFRRPSLTTLC